MEEYVPSKLVSSSLLRNLSVEGALAITEANLHDRKSGGVTNASINPDSTLMDAGDTEDIDSEQSADLCEQVRDLSNQLERIGQLTKACADTSGKFSGDQYAQSPTKVAPTNSEGYCIPSTPKQSPGKDSLAEKLEQRQQVLQSHLTQLKKRLSKMQDTSKPESKRANKPRERDVDDHIARHARARMNKLKLSEKRGQTPLSKPGAKIAPTKKMHPASTPSLGRSSPIFQSNIEKHEPKGEKIMLDKQSSPLLKSEPGQTELKEVAFELRQMQAELRDQLSELQRHFTNLCDTKENVPETGTHSSFGIGAYLPSIRRAMDEVLERARVAELPEDEEPSKRGAAIVPRATATLAAADRRKAQLQKLSPEKEPLFNLVEQMNKDPLSAGRMRVQAMVDEAIAEIAAEKKKRGYVRPAPRPSRPVQRPTRPRTPSPGKKSTLSLTELFSRDPQPSRSPSPSASLRFNRRRAKRPIYPRLINDPVQAPRAVLRLSQENLSELPQTTPSTMRPLSAPPPKSVRFKELKKKGSDQAVRPTTTTGIIPLGRHQYSAASSYRHTTMEYVQTPDRFIHYSQPVQTDPMKADAACSPSYLLDSAITFEQDRNRMEYQSRSLQIGTPSVPSTGEDVLRRLLTQLTNRQEGTSGALEDGMTEQQLRQLIESTLLGHIQSTITKPISVRTSPPRPSSPRQLEPGTPRSSTPQRPPSSLHYRSLKIDVGVGRATPPPQPLTEAVQTVATTKRDTSSSPPSYTTKPPSPVRKTAETSIDSTQLGLKRLAVPRSAQTSRQGQYLEPASSPPERSPKTPESVATGSLPLLSTTDRSTPTSEAFSLTTPDTFSDGLWLVDRSEGEAPYPIPYSVARNFLTKFSPAEIKQFAKRDDQMYEHSTSSETEHETKQRLSDGEIPSRRLKHPKRNNPLHNPILDMMAYQQSEWLDSEHLPHADQKFVRKAALSMSQSRSTRLNVGPSSGQLGSTVQKTPTSPGRLPSRLAQNSKSESAHLEWLKSLAGDSTRTLVKSRKSHVKSTQSGSKPDEPHCGPMSSYNQAIESDATTIDEPVYEDDYEEPGVLDPALSQTEPTPGRQDREELIGSLAENDSDESDV